MTQISTAKISWLDWSEDAFQRAKNENKPILLDISAVWCHWCHRLDRDTYSVPDIAEYVNNHFVPIRVDTDKRPDINRRYNMGGWPTTAFLTPEGHVIGGGTYIPPDQMRQILRDIRSFWEKGKSQPSQTLEMPEPESVTVGAISHAIVNEVLGEAANNFDSIYGGFGSQPKFPNTETHELALLRYHDTGNREFLRIVAVTLQNVGKSGLYDKEMGGFFRYSTTRDWSIPHYEKMCEDNAKWLQLYIHAYQATGDPFYADIAKGIMDYVNIWLSNRENGCFYGSQDADEEYYGLSKVEREKMTPPYVDMNIYTNWNALMITAYLEASAVLGDAAARNFALKSLDRLLSLAYKRGEALYHFYDGAPHLPHQLGDYAQLIRALCYAYEFTGRDDYLRVAEEAVGIAENRLYDKEHGGFFDTLTNPNAPGFLSKPTKPLDENSVAAKALTMLGHLTGKSSYRTLAEETLKRFVQVYPHFGFLAADYALAVDFFLNEPTTIRVIGSLEKAQTKGLLAEAVRAYDPRKIIQALDPTRDREAIGQLGLPAANQPAAYVCVGRVCTRPITEPKQIAVELAKMSKPAIKG